MDLFSLLVERLTELLGQRPERPGCLALLIAVGITAGMIGLISYLMYLVAIWFI